ncbi:unnamed protein product [Closterium sp. NIES-65]|nr:unnamed protein product [Closterium sp. NIES-65]
MQLEHRSTLTPSVTACFSATPSMWFPAVVVDLPLNPRFDPSNLALGFVLDEESFSSQGFNAAFHYASAGFDPAQDNCPAWTVMSYSTWVLPESTWPVKNQRGCGDCWAYAVVAAVEAAHRIASNWAQPLVLSVEHLRLALSSNCDGGSPTKALQFLLNATAHDKGLLEDALYSQGLALKGRWLASTPKYYGIRGIERTGFYGWFGLMLAVQRQPVIVHIEASAPSFQDYDGSGKYADEECFSNHLNHVVLVVGYLSAGSDPSNSAVPPPFWIIRNSWGTAWGDQGHMRMDIRSGDAICGINTLPGLFPVVRTCPPLHIPMPTVSCMYPCLPYSSPLAPVDVCGSSSRNPCVVGTCVNDGKGSYSCVCPPGFIQGTTLANTASCAPGNTPLLLSSCAPGNTPLLLSSCAPGNTHLLLSSCAPGDAGGVYTVRQSNVWCSHVHPIFALTLDQFLQQNKGDTCAGVGRQVELCGAAASDAECEAAFQALNPAVDCSSLKPSQAVCIERDPGVANVTLVCDQYYRARLNDTCDSIRQLAEPPLSPVDFYRLNPGVNCNQLIPLKNHSRSATTFGAECVCAVCVCSVVHAVGCMH